eukprot:COSAG02_NODE_125_length_34972_cov_101.069997_9_plen_362_part_00
MYLHDTSRDSSERSRTWRRRIATRRVVDGLRAAASLPFCSSSMAGAQQQPRAGFQLLPEPVLHAVLLSATTHHNLIRHASCCARVCASWRQVVVEHAGAAYGQRALADPANYQQHTLRLVSEALNACKRGGGTRFSLYNVPVGDDAGDALALALARLPAPLEAVFLTNTKLTAPGLAPITIALRNRLQRLHTLRVNGNVLGSAGVVALSRCVLPGSQLRKLYVGSTHCSDEGMVALAAVLPRTQIELLDCYDNPAIGTPGWKALGAAMPKLPHLKSISLTGCSGMGCKGVAALAHGLQDAPILDTLVLMSCSIGDDGLRSLVAIVSACTALQHLNVVRYVSLCSIVLVCHFTRPQSCVCLA